MKEQSALTPEVAARQARVRSEQIETLLLQGIPGSVAVTVIAGVFVVAVWPYEPAWQLSAWFALSLLLSGLRVTLARRKRLQRAAGASSDASPTCAVLLGAASGAIWGFACMAFIPPASPGLYFMLAAVLTGMPAGAISSFGVYVPAYAAYLACAVLPFAVRFISEEDPFLVFAGATSLVFGTFLLRTSLLNADVLRRNILQRLELEAVTRSLSMARDAAESANRAKSSFLANMSHEIRTPLNAVVGLSELLQENSDNPQSMSHAATIRKAALSLLGIIDDVLDLSRIEAGGMSLRHENFDLPGLLHDIADMFAPVAARKGLAFTLSLDPNLPAQVGADPVRLRQVLVNLLGNAMKFTSTGEVQLVATLGERTAAQATVRFAVVDTGVGIPLEDQHALFRPFTQVVEIGGATTGGTGLGLAITAELVDLMEGSIHLDSAPGRGSTFTVKLPLALAAEAGPDAAAPEPGREIVSGCRILLVEDNEVNQVVASEMLNQLGCEVRIAASGQAALVEMMAERFDLVLMDCQMPGGMDGFETTAAWRTQERLQGGHLPIVALTANAILGDRESCLAAGMDDYLSKPVSLDKLRDVIARFAGEKRNSATKGTENTEEESN